MTRVLAAVAHLHDVLRLVRGHARQAAELPDRQRLAVRDRHLCAARAPHRQ